MHKKTIDTHPDVFAQFIQPLGDFNQEGRGHSGEHNDRGAIFQYLRNAPIFAKQSLFHLLGVDHHQTKNLDLFGSIPRRRAGDGPLFCYSLEEGRVDIKCLYFVSLGNKTL